MNFLKGSLFRRNTEPEELEPMEESGGGILAVWGSPGCGKTVTAVKIAKHLAAQKKNTVLLLCDMTAPMMPCICPPSELEVDKSLGSIFAAQHISTNLIKHAAGWYPDGTGRWDESVDTGDVYGQLASTLGLENTGSGYQKISNGNVEYTISGLSVELSNNALSSGQSKGYTAAVEIRLEVPVRFLGNLLPAAEMVLHTEAKYVPVF